MDAIKNIVNVTQADVLEDIISPFIKQQFPLFVQTDYPKLILFVKSYYEWLEQEGNVGHLTSKLDTVYDVDKNLDEFYSHFKNTYLDSFPELLATKITGEKPNKTNLLKKIRDFYGNKGTESSYHFLFNIIYDSDLEIYYPKTDILKASDGLWIESRSIKTTSNNTSSSLYSMENGRIQQYSGAAIVADAFIDSVIQYELNNNKITEFFINDINGTFLPNLPITLVKEGSTSLVETAYSVLGEFFIELPGSGYRIGDVATIITSIGSGFSAKVQQTGLGGTVKKLSIVNSGINYTGDIIVNIFNETGTQSAKVIALRSAVTNYSGYFSGNRGKLSSNKKIQDGHYYQDFSYELKSEISLDTYFEVLKNLVHPSGLKMFGSVLMKKSLDNVPVSSSQSTILVSPIIGQYTPYTSGTTIDLRANGNTQTGYWLGDTGDLYPLGYNPYIGSTADVGPNGKTTNNGTIFVGTSLGYTYCYVPESGRTSHNPIGGALGSTGAFYLNKEESWTPLFSRDLVLWLKPENIGVCGSMVNGASMDVWTDASPSANHALPPTWNRWTTAAAYQGVTIDKLRPTLVINDGGVVGATGIAFNGGLIVGPQTMYGGTSLGAARIGVFPGLTFEPGTTGEKLLVGRHFYLTNGLTLSGDMNAFIVYRASVNSYAYGSGMICSNKKFTDVYMGTNDDVVVFSRNYNSVDSSTSQQTATYYDTDGIKKYYPSLVGLLGFRPWGGVANITPTNQKHSIAYDPHVSGTSMGMIIGEISRDSTGTLYTYVNGDRATNKSRSTGLSIRSFSSTITAATPEILEPISNSDINIGRFGAYHQPGITGTAYSGSQFWLNNILAGTCAQGFSGAINEVIVYNRKLDETERQSVYGYLSRKYKMNEKLPVSYKSSLPSAKVVGNYYWDIAHHPNTRGLTGITSGISFDNIKLLNFLKMPTTTYRSEGTIMSVITGTSVTRTILAGDTYKAF